MAQRFDSSYKVARGDNLGDPEYWNRRLQDLDLRLDARERDADNIASAADVLVALGLQRLNDTFSPLIANAQAQVAAAQAAVNEIQDVLNGAIDDGTF